MEEKVDNDEIKNVLEEGFYINPFNVGGYSASMASNIKKRILDGWKIKKTKITVSYFIERVPNEIPKEARDS